MSRKITTPFVTCHCLVCGKPYSIPKSFVGQQRTEVCGWACWFDPRRRALASFWKRVQKTDGCWLWTGAKTKAGYGMFEGVEGARISVHRFSFEWHTGEVPGDLLVCHTCDNRVCVNPAHLFLGSHAENSRDMVRKRRNHLPQRKITFEIAEQIRAAVAAGMSQEEAGHKFGLSQTSISKVILGKCYHPDAYRAS